MNGKGMLEILSKYKVIAVVGLSADENKPSFQVAQYMQAHGYQIVPVNPFVEEVLGEKSYSNLLEIPEELQKIIDIVDIFRRSDAIVPIVEQAVELKRLHGKLHVIWMQLGVLNEKAAEVGRAAGLTVIMDKCLMVEHRRLLGEDRTLNESKD